MFRIDAPGADERRNSGTLTGVGVREVFVFLGSDVPTKLVFQMAANFEPNPAGKLGTSQVFVLDVTLPRAFQIPGSAAQPDDRSERFLLAFDVMLLVLSSEQKLPTVDRIRFFFHQLAQCEDRAGWIIFAQSFRGADDAGIGAPADFRF